MSELTTEDRTQLREFLAKRFNLDELKTLCFDLGLDYEEFPRATMSEFTRELVAYFERHGKIGCLIAQVIKVRPVDWLTRLLAQVPGCQPNEKVQIVLSNDKIKSRPDLKEKLAALLGISAEEVMIIATAPGSLKVLVGLPAGTAEKLTSLSLPYQLDIYEIVSATPFDEMPPPARNFWRTAVSSTAASGGGITTIISGIVLGILIASAVIVVAAVIAVVGLKIWYDSQPELIIENQCTNSLPIMAPDSVKMFFSLPETIPSGENITLKVVTGEGDYELTVENGVTVLQLPRPVPFLNLEQVELGAWPERTVITFNGQVVNPLDRSNNNFSISADRPSELVICAPR
ncbi:MAG: hypothetical protein WAM60_09600 [Candidatus Promineifilaceae bacterium]